MPYHNLATSYIELGDVAGAIKSLEQEIELEPGNYFSRLKLADLYEQQGKYAEVEESLKKLLSRDPENIQALHKLISHYENRLPHVDAELMRKRLISIDKTYNEIEIVIKVFHLCVEKMYGDALDFITEMIKNSPAMTMLYLLKAHVLGQLHQFSQKRKQLIEFKKNCHGKNEYMKNKLEEFEHIFGKKSAARLGKILVVTNPNMS
jgi:tetratricopeptide (TPR) repeat protein